MTMAKSLVQITPGLMSVALVGQTSQMIPKHWGKQDKKSTAKFLKGFTGVMIGVPLISATNGMVSKL